jgi:hypothetical protein
MEQIVGRWIFAADGIMPCLAQESGPQSRRNDPGRPSRRSMWRTIGLYRHFAHRDFEELFLNSSHPRNAKCRRHPGFGPTVSPKKFRVVRSRRDTWRTIGLYRHFAHRDFEEQGSAPSHPRNAKCRRHPGFGPTVSPKKFRAIRSRRDTWRTIGLYRHFAHRDFEEQGSAPSHPRNVKCRRRPGFGPTVSSKKFRVVRSRRDTWHTIGLYRHFAYRDFEEQGSAPSHPRNAKCRRCLWVRAHGHSTGSYGKGTKQMKGRGANAFKEK